VGRPRRPGPARGRCCSHPFRRTARPGLTDWLGRAGRRPERATTTPPLRCLGRHPLGCRL
jgi:hypothetical protein